MIINCSMRHSTSGRKRKTNAYSKAKRPVFVAQAIKKTKPVVKQSIPSAPLSTKTKYKTEDNSWKLVESKNWTVAPAYNKGAYQVIPRGDVEWIGK